MVIPPAPEMQRIRNAKEIGRCVRCWSCEDKEHSFKKDTTSNPYCAEERKGIYDCC